MLTDADKERIQKLTRLIERPGTAGEGAAARAALARINARLPVVGRTIERDRTCRCGSHLFKVEPGKGPHAFHLRCASCERGGTWMTQFEAQRLKDEHEAAIKRTQQR
jgi:hypothetical protein